MTQPPAPGPQPGYGPPPGYPPGYPPPPQAGYAVPYAVPGYAPTPLGPGGQPFAEFGDRLLAYLLDYLILTALTIVPSLAAFIALFVAWFNEIRSATATGAQPNPGPFFLGMLGVMALIFGLQFGVTYLYFVTYQLRRGQTVGKRVLKLRIVDAQTGAPMGLTAARKRWIISLLMAFVSIAHLLDDLWMLWDPQKQTLHDKVAATVVVKVPA